jgi:plastocyanin
MVHATALLSTLLALGGVASAGTLQGKTSPANSVVYVDAVAGKTFPAPAQEPVLSQKGLAFSPHILVVQQGTTVQFENDDNVQHNVFWPSVGGSKKFAHNLGTWPKGEKRPFKFTQPGAVPLLCNVHPEMSGYIVVSPTPYFAQTDAAGNYKIDNVPDGKYTVTAWHEGLKPQSKPVSVTGTGEADFTLSQ